MPAGFRGGLYFGLSIALLTGIFFLWLYQPERQVRKQVENLFQAVERKNWDRLGGLIAVDYQDQWGHDRIHVLERTREMFRYLREVRIIFSSAAVQIDKRTARWTGKIDIEADPGELASVLNERVNSLATPFELEWHHASGKPWDWKLVRVSNPGLEIPAEAY